MTSWPHRQRPIWYNSTYITTDLQTAGHNKTGKETDGNTYFQVSL